jgi:CheY-like chemotaxis protein
MNCVPDLSRKRALGAIRGAQSALEVVGVGSRDHQALTVADHSGVAAVLLIDDEDALRQVLKRALVRAGFEVHEAGDGEAALLVLERLVPDIVITDLAMPRLSGIGLARAMASQPHLAHIPVVFMSGHPDTVLPLDGPVLEKPFSLELMIEVINSLLA